MGSETFAMPVAWLANDEDGSPAMVFLDKQEAASYCDGEEPVALVPIAAVLEAIESAAQECDSRATVEGIAQDCASAIRQLADQVKMGVGND